MYLSTIINFDDPSLAMQSINSDDEEYSPAPYPSHAVFSSQAKFSTWIEQTNSVHKDRVTTLRLYLTDFDISPLISRQRIRDPRSTLTIWNLCDTELRRFQQALQGLRNLTFLHIIPPEHAQPAFWQAVYGPLLVTLRMTCPRLVHLELHDSPGLTDVVPLLEQAFRVTVIKEGTVPRLEGGDQGIRPGQIPAVLDLQTALRIVHGENWASMARAATSSAVSRPVDRGGQAGSASSSSRGR